MFYKLIYILMLILLFAAISFAEPLSVNQAVEIAIKQNPDVLSAKAALNSAKAKIPQTLSLDDPRIGIEYDQISSDEMKMFTAEQMIKFPGKIYAEYQMSVNEAEMSGAFYQERILSIKNQVKSAYYDLFFADRSIEIAREIKDILYRDQKAAAARYLIGGAPQTDLYLANIEYLKMDAELANLEKEREVRELKLKSILNAIDDSKIEPEPELFLPAKIDAEALLREAAIEENPSLKIAKAEIREKDSSRTLSIMEYFPDLALGIKERVGAGWDAMFPLSVPLYFWKQGSGVAQAGFERDAAAAEYNKMENMVCLELKEAYVMADSAGRNMEYYEKSFVPLAEQALKVSIKAYASGKVGFADLLAIEKSYQESKLKYLEYRVNYGKALAELEKITGRDLL